MTVKAGHEKVFAECEQRWSKGTGKKWKVGYYGVTGGKMQATNNRQYGDCLLECTKTEKQDSNSRL
jgi:hypothetical protein